ncbi:MAG: ATPase-activating ribosome biosynthesis protein [Sclerophora amabilis]|nr:MAG: ATPase-activating ribosome biosynthesis protein [Sclerophora amabilis]
MKRNPRKLKWTKAFRKAAGKELTVDSTLTFAARRNVPVRYNRDLVATTLKAMSRVSDVRARRERAFYKNRMRGNKERTKAEDRKLVEENEHLLPKEMKVQMAHDAAVAEAESMEVEPAVVSREETLVQVRQPGLKQKQKPKQTVRKRLLVGGGVEDEGPAGGGDMDVD